MSKNINSPMRVPVFLVDTFTSATFSGNPTPVCLPETTLPNTIMHAVAKELNQPVTAFVYATAKPDSYAIKYFTPTGQIPTCGHATLAAAKVLHSLHAFREVHFSTVIKLNIQTTYSDELITMRYPAYVPVSVSLPETLLNSLGLNTFSTAFFCTELETVFIEVEAATIVRNLQPEFTLLTKSSQTIKEVVVTSISDNTTYDYLLRSFCPWIGIDEDLVTGSVHAVLGPFWKSRLGKNHLKAFQASARGGEIYVQTFEETVAVGGKAVLLMQGELFL